MRDILFEIPALLVASSAFVLTIVILRAKDGVLVNIKIFLLSTVMQFFTYVYFHFTNIPIEEKQFYIRLGIITINLALSMIIYAGEKHGK